MSRRKRDDLESGYLYRVMYRPVSGKWWNGDTSWWVHSNCGHYGRPRTYMTLGAARGQRTGAPERRVYGGPLMEYAVQRAPVTEWEVVPDE